jgi:ATP/maltotriose-dependent transcriptional regulator MalT
VCLEVGDQARARELAQQALDFYEKAVPGQRGRVFAVLAHMHLAQGDLAAATDTLHGIPLAPFMDFVRQFPLGLTPETVFAAYAEMALLRGEVAHASEIVDELLGGVQNTETRLYLPTALHLRAKVLLAQNRIDEARDVLVQACAEAEAMQMRHRLVPVLSALSQVESRCNNMDAAQSLRARAREVIDYIAAHSPPDLRESYLNQRGIVQWMNDGTEA